MDMKFRKIWLHSGLSIFIIQNLIEVYQLYLQCQLHLKYIILQHDYLHISAWEQVHSMHMFVSWSGVIPPGIHLISMQENPNVWKASLPLHRHCFQGHNQLWSVQSVIHHRDWYVWASWRPQCLRCRPYNRSIPGSMTCKPLYVTPSFSSFTSSHLSVKNT